MKEESKSQIKTNVAYGLIVLIPIAIIVLLLAKLVEILEAVARPLELQSAFSAGLAVVLALVLVLAVCFIVGVLVRTQIGAWSFERIEGKVLKQVPGYEIVGNVLKGFAENRDVYPPAMVSLYGPGTAVFGFVMEENGNGTLTVFVPSSPALTVGNVYVVHRERVTLLEASIGDVTNTVSQWGIGSRKVLDSTDS